VPGSSPRASPGRSVMEFTDCARISNAPKADRTPSLAADYRYRLASWPDCQLAISPPWNVLRQGLPFVCRRGARMASATRFVVDANSERP